MRFALILGVGLVAGVLGYGWWHVGNHATFYMHLAEKAVAGKLGNVLNAELAFLDASGNVLAKGKTDGKYGVVWVEHPTAGYCGPDLDRASYRACFKTQATWLKTWVPGVRYLEGLAGQCRLERVPLQVSVYRDNVFLWWLPLPHVGGLPYTHYSTQLEIDSRACAVTRHIG